MDRDIFCGSPHPFVRYFGRNEVWPWFSDNRNWVLLTTWITSHLGKSHYSDVHIFSHFSLIFISCNHLTSLLKTVYRILSVHQNCSGIHSWIIMPTSKLCSLSTRTVYTPSNILSISLSEAIEKVNPRRHSNATISSCSTMIGAFLRTDHRLKNSPLTGKDESNFRMPKSKRSKVVSLTKTDRKTKEWKADLFSKIRVAIDQYDYVHPKNPLKPGIKSSFARFCILV